MSLPGPWSSAAPVLLRGLATALGLVAFATLAGCAGPRGQLEPASEAPASQPQDPRISACCELEPPSAHHLRFLPEAEVQRRYRVRLEPDPPRPVAGEETQLSVYVEGVGEGVGGPLGVHRERRIHLTIVSDDLAEVHHFHPHDVDGWREMSILDGRLTVPVVLGAGGRYRVYVDFVEDGLGIQQALSLEVEGRRRDVRAWDVTRTRHSGELQVSLETAEHVLVAGREVNGVFRLRRAGQPVTDLVPFGGALAHVLVLGPDPGDPFLHLHAGGQEYSHFSQRTHVPGYAGPKLYWSGLLETAGIQRVFLLFRRRGDTRAVAFDLRILPAGTVAEP